MKEAIVFKAFLVRTTRTWIALAASYISLIVQSLEVAQTTSYLSLIRSQADHLFDIIAQTACTNTPDELQDIKGYLSFNVCYISQSVRGFVVLLCGSLLLRSQFLSRPVHKKCLHILIPLSISAFHHTLCKLRALYKSVFSTTG